MRRRRPSAELASAILDGQEIDWDRAAAPADRAARPLLGALRVLDEIAKSCGAPRAAADRSESILVNPSLWTVLLAGLAALQIGAALTGYLAGAGRENPIPAILPAAVLTTFTLTALWLVAGGRHDQRAWNLAVFFLLTASAFTHRFLTVLDHAPPLKFLLGGLYPDAFLPVYLWRFVRQFPRTVRFGLADDACRIAARVSAILCLGLFAINAAAFHGLERAVPPVLLRSHDRSIYWALIVVLAAPAVPTAWLRARHSEPRERRRLVLFTLGLGAGIVPPLVEVLAEITIPPFSRYMDTPDARSATAPAFFALLCVVPLLTAYSIAFGRVFDVRIAVGRALQYVFARTSIAALLLCPLTALAVYGYRHRDLTLAALLSGTNGRLLGSLAAVGVALLASRRRVLAEIDRRFFRVTTHLAHELPRLAARLRNTRSLAELADVLDQELALTLHTERAALFLRDPAGATLIPVSGEGSALPVDSGLASLIGRDAAAVVVSPTAPASFYALLPHNERRWIDETGAAIIVPLLGIHDDRRGLVVVGPKRSEAPFSREELSFLSTVASAAALALDAREALGRLVQNDAARERPAADDEPAHQCTSCGLIVASGAGACPCGAPTRTAPVPAVLAGKFRVERLLGAGGMGVVYRGKDIALDRTVALKTLPRLTGEAVDRLGREARMMASVVHPNLATIFGLERWRDTPVLVVELLEGGTLASRLPGGPHAIAEVLRLGLLLAAALEQLHQAGVLHRDIKPSNVAFSRSGIPKLLDFGLASLILDCGPLASQADDAAHAGATQSIAIGDRMIVGTPLYLSPEAARGEAAQGDFDTWSLSLILYEMISGTHPFAAPTVTAVLRKVRQADVADLRRFRPDCPAPVAEAFRMMLSADRRQRPRSAAALRDLLDQLARTGH